MQLQSPAIRLRDVSSSASSPLQLVVVVVLACFGELVCLRRGAGSNGERMACIMMYNGPVKDDGGRFRYVYCG